MGAFEQLVDEVAALDFVHGEPLVKSMGEFADTEASLSRWWSAPRAKVGEALRRQRFFKATGFLTPRDRDAAEISALAKASRAGRQRIADVLHAVRGETATLAKALPRARPKPPSLGRQIEAARRIVSAAADSGSITFRQAADADYRLRQVGIRALEQHTRR